MLLVVCDIGLVLAALDDSIIRLMGTLCNPSSYEGMPVLQY